MADSSGIEPLSQVDGAPTQDSAAASGRTGADPARSSLRSISPEGRGISEEKAFCLAWNEHRRRSFLKVTYGIFIVVAAAMLVVLSLALDANLRRWGWMTWGFGLTVSLLGFLDRRHPKLYENILLFLFLMHGLGNSWALYYVHHEGNSQRDLLALTANIFGQGLFFPLVCPMPLWRIGALIALISASAAFAIISQPISPLWSLELFLCMLCSLGIRALYESFQEAQARSEFRYRIKIAPISIVRHSVADKIEVEELFRPEDKFCVCLSSDWHDYAQLCERLPAAQLVVALNDYYNLCQMLLDARFPAGNYYTDWLADELFIVAYAVDGQDEKVIVNAVTAFSVELLQARVEFSRRHSLPQQVDIGMAAGHALLGLMGPQGQNKVTALGVVPGRARRLQGAGQLLRRRLDAQDRVVFDYECLKRLSQPFKVGNYDLGEGEFIRDLEDRSLYYIAAQDA